MTIQNDRFVRMSELTKRLALGKTKIYAMIKDGEFPAPSKIGKASVWSDMAISNWQMRKLTG